MHWMRWYRSSKQVRTVKPYADEGTHWVTFKIYKEVKMPARGRARYPFDELEVGDCFEIDQPHYNQYVANVIHGAQYQLRRYGKKFTVRRFGDRYGCWRIK